MPLSSHGFRRELSYVSLVEISFEIFGSDVRPSHSSGSNAVRANLHSIEVMTALRALSHEPLTTDH
jgi:hypothetical protein